MGPGVTLRSPPSVRCRPFRAKSIIPSVGVALATAGSARLRSLTLATLADSASLSPLAEKTHWQCCGVAAQFIIHHSSFIIGYALGLKNNPTATFLQYKPDGFSI